MRAIAVFAVVLFHAKAPFFDGGYVGVDVFFVISGFLITAILIGDGSIVRFYQRRARRILPALFALVAVVLAVGMIVLLPHDLVRLAKSTGATMLFGSNVWWWRQSGYFAVETELWPLLHTWSLGVEEQFYIVLPLALIALRKLPRRVLAAVLAIAAGLSLATAMFAMSHLKGVLAFYMMPMRAWELLVGSVLATGSIPNARSRAVRSAAALLGVAAVVAPIILYTPATPFPGLGAAPPVLGSALLIWAGQNGDHALSRPLGCKPMRAIGLISYSLYLWHWPVLAFWRYLAVRPLAPLETVTAVAAAFLLATLSWRFVERPFRRGFSDATIWKASAAGIGVLLGAAMLIVAAHGFPKRFPPEVVALNAEEGETWRCPVTTLIGFGGFYACPLNLPSRRAEAADVVLWGDSHAQMYVPALLDALGRRGALLVNANGCAPVVGDAAEANCGIIQRGNFARIVRLPARTVILAQNWPQYRDEAGARLGRTPLPHERYGDGIRRLRALVAALRQAGKRVIVVAPVPLPGYNLASVAARDLAFHGAVRTPLGVPRAAYLREYANVLEAMAALARDPEVVIVRPSDLICDGAQCRFVREGRAVFADYGHYATIAARGFAPLFARAMAGR